MCYLDDELLLDAVSTGLLAKFVQLNLSTPLYMVFEDLFGEKILIFFSQVSLRNEHHDIISGFIRTERMCASSGEYAKNLPVMGWCVSVSGLPCKGPAPAYPLRPGLSRFGMVSS